MDGLNSRERDKLPPISSAPARKSKPPLPSLGSLINTLNHRRARVRDSEMATAPLGFKHVCELPPIGSLARLKQRTSIDTLPPEVKAPFPCDPVIPLRTKTTKDFLEEAERAALSGDWRELRDFYLTTFDAHPQAPPPSQREANASFDTIEDSGVNAKFINAVYDSLLQTPEDIQKSVLKGIINSLLREWKGPRTKDDLRAYFILVQNPQYSSTSTYVIYAHLLRQMASLSEADHHFLVHWLKKLSGRRFRQPVERLLQFISTRLFPAEPDELPPASKCSWWIPSATKVLALFNAANSVSSPPIMPFTDFYNITLEHIDFMEEYRTWQSYGNSSRFSFCQFPFILSTAVKKAIIQKDSEQQMISQARQSLVSKVSRRQRVDMNLLFLNIKVRRAQLLADSLDELSRKRCDLKKKLRVTFVGEAGLDMGGLTKEWFLLLVRRIFHDDYGMFTYMKESRCHWFSSWKCDSNYSEFQLIGTLMGLAVYNSIALDIHFPLYCYRKLLTPPTAPCDPNAPVGMATATFDDLQQIMPELAHGLEELLNFDGNVEEDVCLTFQVSQEEMGVVKSYNLKPGGDKIAVTKHNRKEYVQLYVDFLLNKSICKQFAAFYHGFHSVCASDALMLLRPEEVEMLVCGSPQLDMSALQKAAHYEGYSKSDATIRNFWEVVLSFPVDLQKKLLHFATGSDRIPVGGMAELNFKISKIDAPTDWLPVSHTCFNQICLPPYRSKKELKHKLTIAISNAEGFGLE
ncbi:probable E3 ubiquitin-protein ligase HECTD2 [Hippocampus comes]|uniref:probable E3 ubiquitin-protein ligase HECTD2 n=1 Tax=Hippocampus comes TaxID=109280 RepID=UPI00094F330B|nr:PREDICTED: probable E3 ubiquitin-protein ligase HECTD2 [Hippocampus comes]